MPSQTRHVAKARENERLSETLQDTPFTDWSVTTMFYSALHWVDAWLAAQPVPAHPQSHVQRNQFVNQSAFLRQQRRNYRELQDRSLDARYECVSFLPSKVEELRTDAFSPLKRHIETALT